jgi:hypothetical protein
MINSLDQLKERLTTLGDTEENAAEKAKIQEDIDMLTPEVSTGVSVCEKTGFDLIEFEEAVREEGGAWLKFMKVPAPEQAEGGAVDAKGKAPPPKKGGKGPSHDDLKPQFGKAWVSFEDL